MSKKKYKAPMPVGNFFPVPNEILQLGLCSGEILVYTYLMYCEDRTTFQCHPSYRTIGKAVGMSQNTVAKHVAGLIEKRLIYAEPTTVQTRKGKKHNDNLLYTIRPIQDAVDYYNERLLLKLEAATEKQCIQKQLDAQKQLHPDPFKEGGDCA